MSQVVLITGASGGIGSAAAKAFAQAGCKVAIHYNKNESAAKSLAEDLTEKGKECALFQADVSDFGQVKKMFSDIKNTLGEVDILVNNAGAGKQVMFQDISPELWRETFAVNVDGVFNCCQEAIPDMIRKKSGRIINISSIWGVTGASCEVHYSAAKAAVIGLTKALAKELGPSNITVNCIAPGVIDTAMNAHLGEDSLNALADETPLCRLGTPEEVADAILFIASDKASFITGQILGVNGGFII
ncbi:MAG: 3-oxoacyl-ACP reductase FabG [Clostridia bacterium]|nr:3-oxoacyl-ACP reductase FabG [Clostridia bacterium]